MKTLLLAFSLAATAAGAQTPPAPAERPLTRDEAAAAADARFARLDTDHDGTLTAGERRAGMAMRAEHDPAHAGKMMTAAEYRDRALRRFDRADTNHDGRLDPAERQAAHDRMRDRHDGGQEDGGSHADR